MLTDADYEAAAIAGGWYKHKDDGLWYGLDVLGDEEVPPGPFKTAKECCECNGITVTHVEG